jgi:sigma-B regulation protein RsbU (phosphoserine phosphatase)
VEVPQAAAKSRDERHSFLGALATVISSFGKHHVLDEMLADATNLLVQHFEVARAEVWLWDDTSRTGYLTHASGLDGLHRRECISMGDGPLGKSAEMRRALVNVPLTGPVDRFDFSSSGNLSHLTAFPLVAEERLVAVLGLYRATPAPETLLQWWTMFADISAIAAERALNEVNSHKQIEQLSLLFEATRLLNSTLDLAELLELILRIAKTEVKADRGTVFLADHKNRELWSIVAQGLESQEIRVPFGRGVAGHVAESGEIINVEDAYTLPFFDSTYDKKFGYTTRSLLCLPIRHRNTEIVGVIQLLNEASGRFSKKDEEFLDNLSGHMAMALENARLHREAIEKQRMERDLAVARQIQRSLLPQKAPAIPGFDIAVAFEPCHECGGDYYDFLSLGPQTMLIVVADVEGKGVGSALTVSNLQATLRALVLHLHSLEDLMQALNEMFRNDAKNQKYLSCFLALLDTKKNGLHYINAGHCPPIVISGTDGSHKLLDKGGQVVGLFPEAQYERGSVQLNSGDTLIIYTDGLIGLGADKLTELATTNREQSSSQLVNTLLKSAEESKDDDKIAMIVKVQ